MSPDMWINIEHIMCVIPKCCHAFWKPHKYLDVPKNSPYTMLKDFAFCFEFEMVIRALVE